MICSECLPGVCKCIQITAPDTNSVHVRSVGIVSLAISLLELFDWCPCMAVRTQKRTRWTWGEQNETG